MIPAPVPADEDIRLAVLRRLEILDTPPEERFDRITRVAQALFQVPIALITLVDANRSWFKSCYGMEGRETPRQVSFCAHAILSPGALVINDTTSDPQFADNPLVTGPPHIRFYAGHPVRSPEGQPLGSVCIIDRRPRQLQSGDLPLLADLAHMAENELASVELNRTSRQLEASEALVQAVLAAVGDAVVMISPSGEIMSANPAAEALFGFDPPAGRGLPASALFSGKESLEWVSGLSSKLSAGSLTRQADLVGVRTDGGLFPIDVTVTRSVHRGKDMFVASIRDVTERKHAEEQLLRLNRQLEAASHSKSAFLATTSHELRTPLNSILGFSELLAEPRRGPLTETQLSYVENIRSSGQHLLSLITELLDLSRIEAGRMELHMTQLEISTIARATVESVRPLAERKAIALEISTNGPLTAHADEARVRQMLLNLLSNAIKFTPESGSVRVTVERREPNAVITVLDSGPGISESDQARVFAEYERLDTAASRAQEGTGLGLALTKRLAELHGGTVTLVSAPGRGSEFAIVLPIAGPSEAPAG